MVSKFDEIYSEGKVTYGPVSKIVPELSKHISSTNNLLDLGVGQGELAVSLGLLGFKEIVGVDLSEVGLNQFLTFAKEKKIKAKAIKSDFLYYDFKEGPFDLIVACATLQFLKNLEQIQEVIEKMKLNTEVGGLNYISLPTKTKIAFNFPFHIENKEVLKEFYGDWEILFCEEFEGKFSNGLIGTNGIILARKK